MICWVYTSPLGLNGILITPENTFIRELPTSVQSAFRGAAMFGVINLTIYAQFPGLNISVAQAAVIEHGYYARHVTFPINTGRTLPGNHAVNSAIERNYKPSAALKCPELLIDARDLFVRISSTGVKGLLLGVSKWESVRWGREP